MVAYTLRPAVPDDAEFLYTVYASTREAELAPVPWTPEQKTAFLRMQFNAQDRHYRLHYGDAQFLVIESGGKPVGRLIVHRGAEEIRIVDISLLPDARGGGIGGDIFKALFSEAAAGGFRVSIHVEKENRARRLYERLGFTQVADEGVYLLMVWTPPGQPAGADQVKTAS